jgi:hypothetical protein
MKSVGLTRSIAMTRSTLILASVFATAASLGATAWADQRPNGQTEAANCTIMGHRIVSVAPHVLDDPNGKRTRRLEGADIRILAEPGMTAEYLTVQVQRHIGAMNGARPMPDCALGVAGSVVEVRSAGDGFVLQITSRDQDRAKEILRRARLLS